MKHKLVGDRMKKVLILILIIASYVFISNFTERKNLIPKEAIRIRVLANSNNLDDQEIKKEVKNNLEIYLYNLLNPVSNVLEAKQVIMNNMGNIKSNIENSLNGKQKYNVNFGKNYFPKKVYKGITYDEGYYDSLLITLGNGLGENWWCVLFPPLCLLEGKEYNDYEYSTYVGELINKYFH